MPQGSGGLNKDGCTLKLEREGERRREGERERENNEVEERQQRE